MAWLSDTEWGFIEPKLRDYDQRLRRLENSLRSNTTLARELGRDVIAARNQLTPLIAEYQRLRALFGMAPAVGLGAVQVLWIVAGTAAAITALWLGVRGYEAIMSWLEARERRLATQAVEETRQQLLAAAALKEQQAAQAQAAGDFDTARRLAEEAASLRAQAGMPGLPPGGTEFPWTWIGVVVLGAFVVPPLIDAFTD